MKTNTIILFIAAFAISIVNAYNTAVYDLAFEMAEYCSISYCIKGIGALDFLIDAPTLQTGELPTACPTLTFCTENSDIEVVQVFNPAVGELSGSGYVAVNHAKKQIVLASRGSYTVQDWLTDFDIALIPYTRCALCAVHQGVYNTAEAIKKQAWSTIKSAIEQYPDYELMSTGHSLGGGLATLLGLEMQLDFKKRVSVVSIAGLKIGNNHFGSFLDKTFKSSDYLEAINDETSNETYYGGYLRLVHEADIVPLVPPTILYAHGGVELYINKVRLPHPQSVTEIKGLYTYEPLSSQLFNILEQKTIQELTTLYEHNNYLLYIYGCNSTSSLVNYIPGPDSASDGNITAAVLQATTADILTIHASTTLVSSITTL